eukprot:1613212-Pyramimonas_sp.AAC.1
MQTGPHARGRILDIFAARPAPKASSPASGCHHQRTELERGGSVVEPISSCRRECHSGPPPPSAMHGDAVEKMRKTGWN